jgi:hypothetical protein
LGEKVSETL